MRILGVDPGIGRMGWGLIDEKGSKVEAIAYDCLETKANGDVGERLVKVSEQIDLLINEYHPENLAIEELFFNTNAKTAFAVGQARGVVILCAAKRNIPVFSYTPPQIKLAVTGYGKADKSQVGNMVKTLLALKVMPRLDDTSDALAVALAHAFSYKLKAFI